MLRFSREVKVFLSLKNKRSIGQNAPADAQKPRAAKLYRCRHANHRVQGAIHQYLIGGRWSLPLKSPLRAENESLKTHFYKSIILDH